ncbi:MAG: hypothetical protein AAF804_13205, partial [Bacteroidota bacterium]
MEGLIAFLQFHDFPVGVDTHLKVANLLDRVGEGLAPERLKTLLAPLFALDSYQQKEFYRLYDAYLAQFPVRGAYPGTFEPNQHAPQSDSPWWLKILSQRWGYLLIQTILLLGLGYLGVSGLDCYRKTGDLTETWSCLVGGPHLERSTLKSWENDTTELLVDPGVVEDEESSSLEPSTSDPITLRQRTEREATLAKKFDLSLAPPQEESLADLRKPWYSRYSLIIRVLLAVFIISFALFIWVRDEARRQLFLLEDRQRQPPLFWEVKGNRRKPNLYHQEAFFQAARYLRQREEFPSSEVDVEGTVIKTTQAAGFPQLAYEIHSRPPEYLVLIEQKGSQDLLAKLYDQLYEELALQDLYLERYFFERDPRVCWQDRYHDESYLEDLLRSRPDHRVVIIAQAGVMLDALSGQLSDWCSLLEREKPVFVLSPDSPVDWGWRERLVNEKFYLLPATIEGLAYIPASFSISKDATFRYWQDLNQYPGLTYLQHDSRIAEVKAYFDQSALADNSEVRSQLFTWFCATGVYPEISWDLTLALGTAFSSDERALDTPQHLYQLLRLPWFRSGRLPVELREEMMSALSPEEIKVVRRVIIAVLKENPPPPGSYAMDEYQVQLQVQQAELEGGIRHNIEALQKVWDYSLHHEVEDESVKRYLDKFAGQNLAQGRFTLPEPINRLLF